MTSLATVPTHRRPERPWLLLALPAVFAVSGCTGWGDGAPAISVASVKTSPAFDIELRGGTPSETQGHQGGMQGSPGATETVVTRTWTFADPEAISMVEVVSQLHDSGVVFRSLTCDADFFVQGSAMIGEDRVRVSAGRAGGEVRVEVGGGAVSAPNPPLSVPAPEDRFVLGAPCAPEVLAAAWPDPPAR